VQEAKKKSEMDRTAQGKEKTGVELKGVKAINPANKEEIPIFVADYVLGNYGTGAIMAVPAHDERDGEFAKKFDLPVQAVEFEDPKEITKKVGGIWVVNYKLRDWVFSRQRYWGEPIPMIHCNKDGWVTVPDDQLPVELPQVEKYQPTDTGESPLASMIDWVNTTCPLCGGEAKRETDVMPNWAGSSWYYLRYTDPADDKAFAGKEKLDYWTPVDWYNGGMEHTVLHLLYSRFWHKFLFDQGLVPSPEPYMKRTSHGLILAADGSKMSKSKGNTVSPDDIVETYGADSLRLYEMFLGPFDQPVAWNTEAIIGVRRFLERIWKLTTSVGEPGDEPVAEPKTEVRGSSPGSLDTLLHQTIKKVGEDIEGLKMNTAVSSLMILLNELESLPSVSQFAYKTLLLLLQPFAPHMASELWEKAELGGDILAQPWPAYDESKIIASTVRVAIQVNGKVRGSIEVPAGAPEEEVLSMARKEPAIAKWLALGKEEKAVYVAGRIISFAVRVDPV
jgi:leucyl-tRNA synthetase